MASASHHHTPRTLSWRHSILPWLAISASLLPSVSAKAADAFVGSTLYVPQAVTTGLDPAATLLRDERIPTLRDGKWLFLQQGEAAVELRKREPAAATEAATETLTKTSTKASTTSTATTAKATTTTETSTPTAAATSASPLPSILDSSLASNFSTGTACPNFIHTFLSDATFKACYPFSMLLQTSRSFFNAEKSIVSTTQVLDATCAANATFCTSYLQDLAVKLKDPANCGDDYKLGNSVVVQAYMGMVAYQPLYAASCLKDTDSGAYCFASAITNTSTTANAYFYFLPLNISFPGSSRPTCNKCLEQTMAIYRSATGNRSLAIASTYSSAAQQLDVFCGPTFANSTLAEVTSSAPLSLNQWLSLSWLMPSILLSIAAQLVLL